MSLFLEEIWFVSYRVRGRVCGIFPIKQRSHFYIYLLNMAVKDMGFE